LRSKFYLGQEKFLTFFKLTCVIAENTGVTVGNKSIILSDSDQRDGSGLAPDFIRSVDPDSESGFRRAKITHKNGKKLRNPPCRGLRISIATFDLKNIKFFSQQYIFFSFWSSKPWIRIRIVFSLKCWIQIQKK
jgi:hypothetical protein